jgi:alpha-aminoadipic semialdehyde synthase
LVQTCKERCFSDEEYAAVGAIVTQDLSKADILLGVKEVAVEALIR